jgi:magnesium transporter
MSLHIVALRAHDTAVFEATLAELPALLVEPGTVVWVDLRDGGAGDKHLLEEVFRLHPMVVEDMLADAPTPKLERYDGYLYIVLHALLPGWDKDLDLTLADLDMMLGSNYLLTVHGPELPSIVAARALVQKNPALLRRGPAFVAHAIIDVLTERFLPLMERLDREIDVLETAIMRAPSPDHLQTILDLRHALSRLRRVGMHQRDVLSRLSRSEPALELVPEGARPFFRDAYDHFVRVTDLNDAFRETLSAAMEVYLSVQGHKLNEIMKMLTLISTIMLPLTFIAGVYGMNFDVMPELHWRWGYFGALGSMSVTALGLVGYFRRKRWL